MTSKTSSSLIFIVIIGAVAAIIAIVIGKKTPPAPTKNELTLTHNEFGSTNPESGTYVYDTPTSVTINAMPNSGYQTNWLVNGVEMEKGINSYTVHVEGTWQIAAMFIPLGGDGTGTIQGIKPMGSVVLLQNYRFWYANPFATVDCQETDENWNNGRCASKELVFKVYDAADRGIPNVQVRVYPDQNPDGTPYKGKLLMKETGNVSQDFIGHDINNPLIVTTDVDGLAHITLFNVYGAEGFLKVDGYGRELSRGTGLYAMRTVGLPPFMSDQQVLPVYVGLSAGLGSMWDGNGGGGTAQTTKLVRAEVVGVAIAQTIASISCNYGTKWKA